MRRLAGSFLAATSLRTRLDFAFGDPCIMDVCGENGSTSDTGAPHAGARLPSLRGSVMLSFRNRRSMGVVVVINSLLRVVALTLHRQRAWRSMGKMEGYEPT
jgi:hypothetical protein